MKTLIFSLMFLMAAFAANSQTVDVILDWDAPTTGSLVVKYYCEISHDNGNTWIPVGTVNEPITELTVTIEPNIEYIGRVCAEDADLHKGVWSEPSNPYIYGVPGAVTGVWFKEVQN